RLDNPRNSSRWYPGGGIYRNVWLVETAPVHVAHWGTYVATPDVKKDTATVKMQVRVENDAETDAVVSVQNEIFKLGADGSPGKAITSETTPDIKLAAHQSQAGESQVNLKNPLLWSLKTPQRYLLVTTVKQNGKVVDRYETPFGI